MTYTNTVSSCGVSGPARRPSFVRGNKRKQKCLCAFAAPIASPFGRRKTQTGLKPPVFKQLRLSLHYEAGFADGGRVLPDIGHCRGHQSSGIVLLFTLKMDT